MHSNGFSLVRKVLDVEHTDLKAPVEALGGKSLGETLLTPHPDLCEEHPGPHGKGDH